MNSTANLSENALLMALSTVIDPEIGANIVELGLVYRVEIAEDTVRVEMTMTSPACPMGELILDDVDWALREALPEGVEPAVALVWQPAWSAERMSDALKQRLGWTPQ